MAENLQSGASEPKTADSTKVVFKKWMRSEMLILLVLFGLVVLVWLPRLSGPLDYRWDGGLYYTLGTSLAEGKGYKLLNEPGEIDAVQSPPLFPLIIAAHQLILGTNDPTTVGQWLRYSFFIIFIIYIYVVFRFFKIYLSLLSAFLATVVCLSSFPVNFVSDGCIPEIPFSIMTVLFILAVGKSDERKHSIAAYIFAVASYALRAIGIAAFAVWVLDSLLRRKYKQAAIRFVLVLIPVFCWQFYIATVESSYEYNHPAYVYQRAPYMFQNVSYAQNLTLHDPFSPEKGARQTVNIVSGNVLNLPVILGEAISIERGYWERALRYPLAKLGGLNVSTKSLVFLLLYIPGFFVLGGLIIHLWRFQSVIALYVLFYLAAVCWVPFLSDQSARYLMPIVPFLLFFFIIFLSTAGSFMKRYFPASWSGSGKYLVPTILSIIVLAELYCLFMVLTREYRQISYFDKNDRLVEYRMFFNDSLRVNYDYCVDYIKENAPSDVIIATSDAQWVYLRTGLKAVMLPLEIDPDKAQQQLDSVPAEYIIVGKDYIKSDQYILPVVERFPEKWEKVYTSPESNFAVYRRSNN